MITLIIAAAFKGTKKDFIKALCATLAIDAMYILPTIL